MVAGAADSACAVLARQLGADPIGSAPRFDDLVLVEAPLPWPSEATEIPSLAAAAAAHPSARVMAVVPDRHRGSGERMITWYRRVGRECRFVGRDILVPAERVGDVVGSLLRGEGPTGAPAPPEFLVCTHGARDRCCGSMGTRLHATLERGEPDWRVRRCSHLGGHRFAPTGMSLPDGHLWAHLRESDVRAVMERGELSPAVLDHCRGTPLLAAPFQVLERLVLGRFGWPESAWEVVGAEQAGDRSVLTLGTPDGAVEASGDVHVRRELAVPVCGAEPGGETTCAPEYAVDDAVVRSTGVPQSSPHDGCDI